MTPSPVEEIAEKSRVLLELIQPHLIHYQEPTLGGNEEDLTPEVLQAISRQLQTILYALDNRFWLAVGNDVDKIERTLGQILDIALLYRHIENDMPILLNVWYVPVDIIVLFIDLKVLCSTNPQLINYFQVKQHAQDEKYKLPKLERIAGPSPLKPYELQQFVSQTKQKSEPDELDQAIIQIGQWLEQPHRFNQISIFTRPKHYLQAKALFDEAVRQVMRRDAEIELRQKQDRLTVKEILEHTINASYRVFGKEMNAYVQLPSSLSQLMQQHAFSLTSTACVSDKPSVLRV